MLTSRQRVVLRTGHQPRPDRIPKDVGGNIAQILFNPKDPVIEALLPELLPSFPLEAKGSHLLEALDEGNKVCFVMPTHDEKM
jgi:hypothetical protein